VLFFERVNCFFDDVQNLGWGFQCVSNAGQGRAWVKTWNFVLDAHQLFLKKKKKESGLPPGQGVSPPMPPIKVQLASHRGKGQTGLGSNSVTQLGGEGREGISKLL